MSLFKNLKSQVDACLMKKCQRKYGEQFKKMIHSSVYLNKELYILETNNIELPLTEFQQYDLKKRHVRKVLSDAILELNRKYPGEKRNLLRKLYQDLDLEIYLLLDLELDNAEELAESIHNLLELEIDVEYTRVRRFLRHRSPMVRKATKQYVRWKSQPVTKAESENFA